MRRRTRIIVYTGASGLWAMAVLGAIAVSKWLELDTRTTFLVVVAVALMGVAGTFLPAVQLGIARARELDSKDPH